MKFFTHIALVIATTALATFSTHAQDLPESLKGAPEKYISVSLCLQIASSYYYEDKGIEPVKAVGRASYDCNDEIEEYVSLLMETPSISEARRQSSMTINDAVNFLKATQIFQMKEEVLRAITTAEQ